MRAVVRRNSEDSARIRASALHDMLKRLSDLSRAGTEIALLNYAVLEHANGGASDDFLIDVIRNASDIMDIMSESEDLVSESDRENIRSAVARLKSISSGLSQNAMKDMYDQILILNSAYDLMISNAIERLKNISESSAD